MAGLDCGPAVPVWLAEDDLGCIICQGLLAWPVTLPCGHSFCRGCLKGLWGAGPSWSCPTCREGDAQPLRLRKNTLLQDQLSIRTAMSTGILIMAPCRAALLFPSPHSPHPRRGLLSLRSLTLGFTLSCCYLEQSTELLHQSGLGRKRKSSWKNWRIKVKNGQVMDVAFSLT